MFSRKQGLEYWAGFGQLVDKNCLNNHQLTALLSLSLVPRTELWVVTGDNSMQKQGVEYQAGFGWSVDNNCLKNQQLTPLLMRLFQQTELWVVPGDHFAQK